MFQKTIGENRSFNGNYIFIQGNPGDLKNDLAKLVTGQDNYFTGDDANEHGDFSHIIRIDQMIGDFKLAMALGTIINASGSGLRERRL